MKLWFTRPKLVCLPRRYHGLVFISSHATWCSDITLTHFVHTDTETRAHGNIYKGLHITICITIHRWQTSQWLALADTRNTIGWHVSCKLLLHWVAITYYPPIPRTWQMKRRNNGHPTAFTKTGQQLAESCSNQYNAARSYTFQKFDFKSEGY